MGLLEGSTETDRRFGGPSLGIGAIEARADLDRGAAGQWRVRTRPTSGTLALHPVAEPLLRLRTRLGTGPPTTTATP